MITHILLIRAYIEAVVSAYSFKPLHVCHTWCRIQRWGQFAILVKHSITRTLCSVRWRKL